MKNKLIYLFTCISLVQVSAQNPLTLDDCRKLALTHNKTVAIANETVKAANELKKAAFAQFLPNFSANGTYAWNQKNISLLSEDQHLPVINFNADGSMNVPSSVNNTWVQAGGTYVPLDAAGNPFDPNKNPEKLQWKSYALLPKDAMEFEMHNVFAGTIGFTQPIFMGGKIKELYQMAKYNEQLAIANKDSKTYDLMTETDEAYWRVVSIKNKYSLAKDYRNLLSKMDSDVSVMVETGVATKSDRLKVKVKLNEAEVMLIKAENGYKLSRMALNQLCGLPLDQQTELADNDMEGEIESPKLLPMEQAISNRPEIKQLAQMQNIAESNKNLMISRFLPTIALSGNYLISNPNVYNGYENKFGGMFNVAVVAHVPLFHFGEKIYTLNAAKAQQRIAEMKMDEAKEKIELQINQNAFKSAESFKKRNATQKNVDQAKENLQNATIGFNEGVITSTDLMGAQTAWLSAKSEDIDAAIEAKLSALYLEKAMGNMVIPQTDDNQTNNKKKK